MPNQTSKGSEQSSLPGEETESVSNLVMSTQSKTKTREFMQSPSETTSCLSYHKRNMSVLLGGF